MAAARQLSLFKGKRQKGFAPPAPTEFASQAFLVDVIRLCGAVRPRHVAHAS
jgi:hypothetical protein